MRLISKSTNALRLKEGFENVLGAVSQRRQNSLNQNGYNSQRHYSIERQLPTETDVVIVGGGIMGCFTLYQLARLGCSPVLLERHKLTSGTTWHTNGLLWRIRPGEVDTALLNATRDVILELEKEEPIGWTENGGLFIASNKTRLDEYARLYTIGRTAGVECDLLTPKEVKERWPLLNVDDVTGALYSPGDGALDPSTICNVLTRQACKLGAKVYEGVDVTEIDTKEGLLGGQLVQGVNTSAGAIKTKAVVNCTGVWCEDILKSSESLPQVTMEHCIVVMEPLPGAKNMPNVRDHDASTCFRVQGESLIIGGYELNASTSKVDRSFAFSLYDFKMDNFLEIMEGAFHRVPKLADMGIKAEICGPESFTPDRKPILGEDWDIHGLYHGFGFNSSGIMLSGGCSEQLAHWILHGRPIIDMAAFDCRRFPKRAGIWKKWTMERSHEAYTSNYNIVFPNNQPLASRAMITDPLYQKLTDSGCFWEETLGWERPGFFTSQQLHLKPYDWKGAFGNEKHEDYHYRDVLQQGHTFDLPIYYDQIRNEYNAMKNTSALINRSSSGKLSLSGPDVQKAVDWLFLCDTEREGGRLTSSVVLNKRGGIEANVTVFTLDQPSRLPSEDSISYVIQCDSGAGSYVRRLLRDMCLDKGLQVSVQPITYEIGCLLLAGPKSRDILQATLKSEVSISLNFHAINSIEDSPLRVIKLSENLWELHIAMKDLVSVYDNLMKNGNGHLVNAGYRAMNIHQLEMGISSWHSDIRADDTPLEAGILTSAELLDIDRDFIGKSALLNQLNQGITKSRVSLLAQTCRPLWGNEGIVKDGHIVGIVRRADYSFSNEASIAIGYVKHPNITVGTVQENFEASVWEIESQGERYPARLCRM